MRSPDKVRRYTAHRFDFASRTRFRPSGLMVFSANLGKWMHGGKVVWLENQYTFSGLHFAI